MNIKLEKFLLVLLCQYGSYASKIQSGPSEGCYLCENERSAVIGGFEE